MIASWTDVEYIEVNLTMDSSMNQGVKLPMHIQASIVLHICMAKIIALIHCQKYGSGLEQEGKTTKYSY